MEKLYFREATSQDLDLTFEWANDPITRSNSFNSSPIPFDEHQKWFLNKIVAKDAALFILMSEEIPAGVLRFDIGKEDPKTAELSYQVAPSMRGKGFGKYIISNASSLLWLKKNGIEQIIAHVKSDNTASISCFKKANFIEKPQDNPLITSFLLSCRQ